MPIAFSRVHPAVLLSHFLSLLCLTVFTLHPFLIAFSLLGAAAAYLLLFGWRRFLHELAFYIPMFLLVALSNPLFSHAGITPLFFLNGNPVTLEALLYGCGAGALLTSVFLWCQCMSALMTTDHWLFLFGRTLPRLSLLLTMSLRLLPHLRRRWREIRDAQTALGFCSERGIVNRFASSARIFSALVSDALEGVMETAASMKARGYGLKNRTHFALWHFTRRDGISLLAILAPTALTLAGLGTGALSFAFYPAVSPLPRTPLPWLFSLAFALLAALPLILTLTEVRRWKS